VYLAGRALDLTVNEISGLWHGPVRPALHRFIKQGRKPGAHAAHPMKMLATRRDHQPIEAQRPHATPVQKAWMEIRVSAKGDTAKTGQIDCKAIAPLLKDNKNPSEPDIDTCDVGQPRRCGTYQHGGGGKIKQISGTYPTKAPRGERMSVPSRNVASPDSFRGAPSACACWLILGARYVAENAGTVASPPSGPQFAVGNPASGLSDLSSRRATRHSPSRSRSFRDGLWHRTALPF